MFKYILFGLLLIASISFSQENNFATDEKTGKPILIGINNRNAFQDSSFAWWFNSGYKFYSPDTLITNEINAINVDSLKITIVMGTWCSDSRREVPRFFKILDKVEIAEEKIQIIGVDRNRESSENDITPLNIELVPTFIFYENEKEIGRIIETPENSLESDMLKILKKE